MNEAAQNRRESRRRVYLGEGIKVYVKDIDETRSTFGEITNFSPWGVNVYFIDQKLSTYPKKDDIIKIFYSGKKQKTSYSKGRVIYVIEEIIDDTNYLKYGIEFINDNQFNDNESQGRKYYDIPDIFGPQCWCDDPFFFQEKLVFKIKSIHANGMTLITSARNKTLLSNIDLQLNVSIPTCGDFLVNVQIFSVQFYNKSTAKDRYIVEVIFDKNSSKFLQVMVEYILFCGVEVTPLELRQDNLPVNIIENSLTYYYAIEAYDMEKVIQLRKNSLIEFSSKDRKDNTEVNLSEKYTDKFDSYSRQVLCKVGKRAVACIRLIFNNKDKNKSEIYSYVEKIPDWLWSIRFVEISKFSWDRDYRESDIFINMIRHIVRIVIESGNTHLLTTSPEALVPLYLKVGFQPLEMNWKKNIPESKTFEKPLLLDAKGILSGEIIMDKFLWNKIYSRIANYLGLNPNLKT